MSTFNFTITDANFAAGQTATGTDVSSRTNQIRTFLLGNNLDPTNNINVTVAYPWTARHSWTVSDSANDNMQLTVGSVMAASKYGFHISSSAAQVNTALQYIELTNASSTTPCYEAANAGSGSGYKVTQSGTGSSFIGNNSSTSNTNGVASLTQAGTGPIIDATLRTLTGLNTVLLAKKQTTVYTVSNSSTETVNTDLTTTLPANFLKEGTTIRGTVWGVITTPGAGPATVEMFVKYGGTAGTILLDTGAITPTVSLTNSPVKMDFMITCISTGGSGTVEAQGMITLNPSGALSATVGPSNRGMGTAGTGVGNSAVVTVDTTLSKDLIVSFKMGSAVVGSAFSFRAGTIEILT